MAFSEQQAKPVAGRFKLTAVHFMLMSALGFALMAACVKQLGSQGIPVLEIVAARSIVSLVISYLDIRHKGIPTWGHNKPLLMLRGLFGTLALMAVFYAVITLPLAQATLLQYTYPAFTAVLALVFLKERIQLATLACILLCLLGLMMVTAPNWQTGNNLQLPWLSVTSALLGAFGSACAYVLVRKLGPTEDSSVIILYFPLIALPVSATLLLVNGSFVLPNWPQLGLLLLVGIFTQIGQIGLTKAMSIEKAGKASAYAYVQVVFAALLGWLLFGEQTDGWAVAGGTLIITGALINTFWKR